MNKSDQRPFLNKLLLALLLAGLWQAQASAQVAVSVGVQGVYDDNVFLEDDIGAFTPEALEEIQLLPEEQQRLFALPERQNGDPDSDFITNLSVGASGGNNIGKIARINYDATVGASFFANVEDQDRWSLDSLVVLSPQEYRLPRIMELSLSSAFQTDSFDSDVAEGSIAQETMRHTATLATGLSYDLSRTVTSRLTYRFGRTDFIGSTTFNDEEEVSELVDDRDNGADFFSHSFGLSLVKRFSARTEASFSGGAQLLDFSDSSDDEADNDEIDRTIFRADVGASHILSNAFSVYAGAGFSKTEYKEGQVQREGLRLDTEGVQVIESQELDDSATTAVFSGGIEYTPSNSFAAGLMVDQSVGLNASGTEVGIRTINLNASYLPTNRLALTLGGQHFETDDDNDREVDGLERLSATASASYSISPSLSLGLGYSFTQQSSDLPENGLDGLLFRSEEYQSNKFFISLNKGFVGLPG